MAPNEVAFYVYIVARRRSGTIYIGMTDELCRRIWRHKTKAFTGSIAKYGWNRLVWYEVHETREEAFRRERQLKDWRCSWKLRLIEDVNPTWADLYERLNG